MIFEFKEITNKKNLIQELKIYKDNGFNLEKGHINFLKKYAGRIFKEDSSDRWVVINAEEAIDHCYYESAIKIGNMLSIRKNLIPVGDFDGDYEILVADDETIYINVYGKVLYGGNNLIEFLEKAFSTNMAFSEFEEMR